MDIDAIPNPCETRDRRAARRQTRREAILNVAQRSFLEHGYAATKMSAIAAELGGSKGTLWSYFPAKDLLFAAVVDRATEAFQQQLTLLLNPQDELEATLRRFARGFLQRVTSPEALALYRLVVAEAGRFPETGRIFQERAMGRTRAQVATYLAGMMTRGLLRNDDPEMAAQQLVGLCLSGSHQMMVMRSIESVDAALLDAEATNCIATFLRAFSSRD
ncbi:MAG: TetR/AcrR family transcriptional regulator [Pseudomonadota bacterium]|nr:TetR/AcrR family transcriptional regulator [Pseudomonadota bacterium]